MDSKQYIPWVEKYRPTSFEEIVLGKQNKRIMENILKTNSFPNLLFYGPPGTGKTTTVINLIAAYQKKNNQSNKELTIHLNASDDRGIDIIRNHISQFVNSKALFNKGTKFIILDEVDSMTTNAQHALKYLLHGFNKNVRFCLICNYISRIDEPLQNEFIRLRFNQLPQKNIIKFLSKIISNENVNVPLETLKSIQGLYKSDIRSMINYIQSNKNKGHVVITDTTWEELLQTVINSKDDNTLHTVNENLDVIGNTFNIEPKNIVKEFLNFIIRNKKTYVTPKFLNFCEVLMHIQDTNIKYYKNYFAIFLRCVLIDSP